MTKNLFNSVLITLLPLFATAQKANLRLYTVVNGLPQNSTTSVTQDPQGFIWINANGTPTHQSLFTLSLPGLAIFTEVCTKQTRCATLIRRTT